ncbi:MAG: amidohydrolase family protein [Saccharospirillaceae bacterium]|nr:amidohydrolase family protein [Saccharospirillaceae bacterium]
MTIKTPLIVMLAILATMTIGFISIFNLPDAPKAQQKPVSLNHVTVINPTLNRLQVANLSVEDGAIRFRESSSQPSQYDGSFVLPGLVNMHSHTPGKNLLNLSPMFSLAAIMHGVTTWRDALDPDGSGVAALHQQIRHQHWPTPQVFSCAVVTRGDARWPNSNFLEEPHHAEGLIYSLKQQGHSCIKSYENLSQELISSIKHAAHRHGMQVIGHVPEGLTFEQAALPDTQHFFGINTITQFNVLSRNGDWRAVHPSRIEEISEFIIKNKLINTPTLVTLQQIQQYRYFDEARNNLTYQFLPDFYLDVVWHPTTGLPAYRNLKAHTLTLAEQALRKKQLLLKKLHDGGATLNIGTDTQQPFVVPGIAMWQEMRLFQQSGIDPEQVLAYASWKARQQLPIDKTLALKQQGLVENNGIADFLIFSRDPTLSLDNLDSLQAVVVRGKLYDINELKKTMSALQQHYRSWPLNSISKFFAKRSMQKIASKFTH